MNGTCTACGGLIERDHGGWRHLARWEPCVSARPSAREARAMSGEQRKALAAYLRHRSEQVEWKCWAAGGLVWFYVALLSRGSWAIFGFGLLLAALVVVSLTAFMTYGYAALRRETGVVRATGSFVVETRGDVDGGARSVRIDGRRISLDGEVRAPREIGGIEFTAGRSYPLAIWDRDGDLIWHRAEYEPLTADRMALTA